MPVFLLPADLPEATSQPVKYLGKHSMTNGLEMNYKGLGDIYCFQLDFETVRDSYLKKETFIREKLIEAIFAVHP